MWLSWLTTSRWTALFWSCLLPAAQAGGHSTGRWGGQEARACMGQETAVHTMALALPCHKQGAGQGQWMLVLQGYTDAHSFASLTAVPQ